jgi:hypothetical protein
MDGSMEGCGKVAYEDGWMRMIMDGWIYGRMDE